MMQLTAYRCLECGHYTISSFDGRRCTKCCGYLQPMGNATYVDKDKSITLNVSIRDIDIFKCAVAILRELSERVDVPTDIKEKINIFVTENCKAK